MKLASLQIKHVEFINATLAWYSLLKDRLVCLIGDDCWTNKTTTDLIGTPLLGCRSHQHSLAVEAYIGENLAVESELVGKPMSKSSTLRESQVGFV
ncbi:hypothetical protein BASA50_000935 [Batrachochytrium salamandrivorans]|uniref:Uncharacterized protein n=1 Tax=Batrachochytrium salamandrivorans TaxID=1357716 RepID=A0ABQ8ESR8_9FUNG|nr:hypothetical protein BASA60_002034 [Batrachochytrium salamandrivorans]KAH6585992.1 hypothetical protein BASA50_000935 [Batrachochytrium salamandrivorans]KAH6595795.1 hypothetical protein BASA61_003682 [Batrachochytrium salamandrivorans]KAH9245616.1 hypothetical protein BASA81_016890 [Batrachochytrium salamandrivorans]